MIAKFPAISYRKVNIFLSAILALLAFYIIVWPFLPALSWFARYDAPFVSTSVDTKLNIDAPVPEQNTLVIPSLGLEETIYEGSDVSTVHQGVWRRPNSSEPVKGNNTVLVGHRFTYDGPAVFYHLDKVNLGDEIGIYWSGKLHTYAVIEKFVVPATAVEVEAPTVEPILTLYTCTPLLTAKDRLVVQARLVE